MATFSVNQVRQLYVAKELKSPRVVSSDAAGAIAVKNDNENLSAADLNELDDLLNDVGL